MKNFSLKISVVLLLSLGLWNCSTSPKEKNNSVSQGNKYLISTKFGDIKIVLFDETPLHRDNFKKLVEDSFYNGTIFHRVISNFMIQGGDPDSKNASEGQRLGAGNLPYTIPAEIVDSLIHKKGALAAARQSDQVNPKRNSSGSQFYIVQGASVNEQQLKSIERNLNNARKRSFGSQFMNDSNQFALRNKFLAARSKSLRDSAKYYGEIIERKIDSAYESLAFKYSEKNIQLYDSLGGTPHLDGQYTVFGEVVEGLEIIDSIAKVQKDKLDRPLEDIKMTIKKL